MCLFSLFSDELFVVGCFNDNSFFDYDVFGVFMCCFVVRVCDDLFVMVLVLCLLFSYVFVDRFTIIVFHVMLCLGGFCFVMFLF